MIVCLKKTFCRANCKSCESGLLYAFAFLLPLKKTVFNNKLDLTISENLSKHSAIFHKTLNNNSF